MARKAKKVKESASVIGDREYATTRIRGADGKVRSSRGNGDAVAKALLLFTAAGGDIKDVVTRNKLDDKMKPHMKKQEGLRRMTLGVMLRALVRNGTPVRIGKVTVEKLSQKVEMPKVEKLPAKPAPRKKAKRAAPKRARKAKVVPNEVQDHEGIAA